MVNISNKNIFMTKGDTAKITLTIKNKNGVEYYLQDGDSIKMAVRKPHSSKDEFTIITTTKDIVIDKSKTDKINVGVYEYDVQLTFANGEVNTIVPVHKFVVQKEVS